MKGKVLDTKIEINSDNLSFRAKISEKDAGKIITFISVGMPYAPLKTRRLPKHMKGEERT